MGITYGDHLIDSGHYDITPEQEREIEAREECKRRGLDPDDDAADGALVWMVVDQEMRQRSHSMAELKLSEVLSFDDGILTVKMSGHGASNGWATLAFNEKQFELDDEGFQVVEIPPSELFELRDFLNRILAVKRPVGGNF